MPINYNILLESEKELKRLKIEYFEYVKYIHTKMWKEIFEKEAKKEEIISIEYNDVILRRLDQAAELNSNLIDECVWTISKDSPRANHLRFIISIIQSAKDLERASAYAFIISKTITRRKILIKNLSLLKPIVFKYLEIFDLFINLYKTSSISKLEKVDEIISDFKEAEHKFSKNLWKKFENESSESEVEYFPISLVLKSIESTVERIKGVFGSEKFVNTKTALIDLSEDLK
ncbi:PhoU domain-containing protein [[Mycoplasma] mobile]|uniref:PhoU domain-containing protein n=1 Tax=[Mycoplasma] mobile TaxID=2118 RepID=UPI0000375478|nr:PhoU domain-containing protein [[Mycoplasma] mobile]AAT27497.1 truncated phosphate uptake regulatory protein [Mycoplasma mobile 163K]